VGEKRLESERASISEGRDQVLTSGLFEGIAVFVSCS
jgi:hypothetical protein